MAARRFWVSGIVLLGACARGGVGGIDRDAATAPVDAATASMDATTSPVDASTAPADAVARVDGVAVADATAPGDAAVAVVDNGVIVADASSAPDFNVLVDASVPVDATVTIDATVVADAASGPVGLGVYTYTRSSPRASPTRRPSPGTRAAPYALVLNDINTVHRYEPVTKMLTNVGSAGSTCVWRSVKFTPDGNQGGAARQRHVAGRGADLPLGPQHVAAHADDHRDLQRRHLREHRLVPRRHQGGAPRLEAEPQHLHRVPVALRSGGGPLVAQGDRPPAPAVRISAGPPTGSINPPSPSRAA